MLHSFPIMPCSSPVSARFLSIDPAVCACVTVCVFIADVFLLLHSPHSLILFSFLVLSVSFKDTVAAFNWSLPSTTLPRQFLLRNVMAAKQESFSFSVYDEREICWSQRPAGLSLIVKNENDSCDLEQSEGALETRLLLLTQIWYLPFHSVPFDRAPYPAHGC